MRARLKTSVAYRALIWSMSALATVSAATVWAKETVLYSFKGGADGAYPVGPLIKGPKGELYGTTMGGGGGNGTVIELDPPAGGRTAWTEKVLYRFKGGNDGTKPLGGLLRDKTGALYGTTSEGGSGTCSTYKSFSSASNFSGIDYFHHQWIPDKRLGCGTVFRLTPPAKQGGLWTEAILHQFAYPEGRRPAGSLLMDKTGALYGLTSEGGTGKCGGLVSSTTFSYHSSSKPPTHNSHTNYLYGCGTIFKLTPPASGSGFWNVSNRYEFSGGGDGAYPETLRPRSSLGITSTTVFFVLTSGGTGAPNTGSTPQGNGTLVQLTPTRGGSIWKSTVLHTFGVSDGPKPVGPLLVDAGGRLYAATMTGGPAADGAILQFSINGAGTWNESIIHVFEPPHLPQGYYPAGLTSTQGFDPVNQLGALYGTTSVGGNLSGCQGKGCGVVFKLAGTGTGWAYSVKYIFGSGADGRVPKARPTIDGSGVIYGTTEGGGMYSRGTVYEITP